MWKNSGGTHPASSDSSIRALRSTDSRIFNNIAKTSEIPLKSDYALFKKGVRPEWEDAANKEGGKWSYQFKRNAGIDELWLYTVSLHILFALLMVDACGNWGDT